MIGQIHQDLRALARLCVFIGYIVHRRVVADVAKMPAHSIVDGYCVEGHSQETGELFCIAFCAPGCPKTGHRDSQDALARKLERVKGPHRYQ